MMSWRRSITLVCPGHMLDHRRRGRRVAALAVAAALVSATVLSLAGGGGLATASPVAQRVSPCTCSVDRTVMPGTIRLCDTSVVTVTLAPGCPGARTHIVFIIDEVYKPNYSNPADRTQALRNAVQRLQLDKNPNMRVGVVWMKNGSAQTRVQLTNDARRVMSNLDVPVVSRFVAPQQCFQCGFREAIRVLDNGVREFPDDEIFEIIVLAPLGVYSGAAAPGVIQGSNQAKGRGVTVISTCFAWTHCSAVLKRAASQPRLYLAYGEGNRLAALLHDVVRDSVMTFLRTVRVTEVMPPSVRVVTGSVSPAPVAVDPGAGTIDWTFADPISATYTLTYRVQPLEMGVLSLGEGSLVAAEDSQYRVFEVPIPAVPLTVSIQCPVEMTPTPPPSPTSTPPPATATATRLPEPIYLPIAVLERCQDLRIYADVVLVMDMSTSMRQPAADGRTKLAAAQDAARTFVRAMTLAPDAAGDNDRIAIVGFNREAWVAAPLTADRAALRAAIDALPEGMKEHTRLDLAVKTAGEVLATTAAGHSRAMVLLTDGLPNQVPYAEDGTMATTILRLAAPIKASGALIYVIGLGRTGGPAPQINPALLRAIANRPAMAYFAPRAEDLRAIYRDLAAVIPCGLGPYWPGG